VEGEVGEVLPRASEISKEREADGLRFGERKGLEFGEGLAREFGDYFVLNDDVGLEALAVLRDELFLEGSRE